MNIKLLNAIHAQVNEVASYCPDFLEADQAGSQSRTISRHNGQDSTRLTIIDRRARYRVIRDIYNLETKEAATL